MRADKTGVPSTGLKLALTGIPVKLMIVKSSRSFGLIQGPWEVMSSSKKLTSNS